MPLPWLDRCGQLSWPRCFGVLVLAVTLTLAIASSAPVVTTADDPPPTPSGDFEESVVTPSPTPEVAADSQMIAPPCGCWKEAPEESWFYLTTYGGPSYIDSIADVSLGGTYGANLSIPLYGALGFAAGGGINHYDGGTQYGSSFGLHETADRRGGSLTRFGWSAMIEHFTDSGLDHPYIVQGAYGINYALTETVIVGARYTDPWHTTHIDASEFVSGLPGQLPVLPVEVVEANITYGSSIMDQAVFGVGYIDELESMTYRTLIIEPMSDRVSTTLNASYDEQIGRWSGFFGLSIDLSPSRVPNRVSGFGMFASRSRSSDVVRGGAALTSSVIALEEPSGPDWEPYEPFLAYDPIRAAETLGRIRDVKTIHPKPCSCPPGYVLEPGGMCVNFELEDTVPCS